MPSMSSRYVLRYSGHEKGFTDPLIDNKLTKKRYRFDHLLRDQTDEVRSAVAAAFGITQSDDLDTFVAELLENPAKAREALMAAKVVDAADGKPGDWTEPRQFNLMFKTQVGPVPDDDSIAYLPPETAQGIFINFDNVVTSMRRKLPLGIAQTRVSFRNEITPGRFIFRTLEFEQMEMEYFTMPPKDRENPVEYLALHRQWIDERLRWYTEIVGIAPQRLRLRDHEKEELSHYSAGTTDIEYLFPWGWGELEGIAARTDFDLKAHAAQSGKSITYFDEETKEHVVPWVIEPAAGLSRTLAVTLLDAYHEELDEKGEKRIVLKFRPNIAPVKVAVLPLSKNEKLQPAARRVHELLRSIWMTQYDETQSIGRRYRRQDEIGTPVCVTIDFKTVGEEGTPGDDSVTIRDRDTQEQVRVPIDSLVAALRERLG